MPDLCLPFSSSSLAFPFPQFGSKGGDLSERDECGGYLSRALAHRSWVALRWDIRLLALSFLHGLRQATLTGVRLSR